jgi:predicted DNA-binding transcriptional regulator AlpA
MPGENKGKSNQQPRMDELISLREAAELSGLTQPHLALMIQKGELWGKRWGEIG